MKRKKVRQIVVFCDLGGWKLTKCIGTFRRGFRAAEPVEKEPPRRVMRMRNTRRYNNHYRIWGYARPELDLTPFPYPEVEIEYRKEKYG